MSEVGVGKTPRHLWSGKEVVPWHHPPSSVLCPQSMGDKGVEGCWMDPLWDTRLCIVELSDFVWGSYVQLWDPRVFLLPIPFPFYQELELASHKSAVQNSFYYVVFFSIHYLWWRWWMSLLTWNGVFWSLEKLDVRYWITDGSLTKSISLCPLLCYTSPTSSPFYFCHISNTPPFIPVSLISPFIPASLFHWYLSPCHHDPLILHI